MAQELSENREEIRKYGHAATAAEIREYNRKFQNFINTRFPSNLLAEAKQQVEKEKGFFESISESISQNLSGFESGLDYTGHLCDETKNLQTTAVVLIEKKVTEHVANSFDKASMKKIMGDLFFLWSQGIDFDCAKKCRDLFFLVCQNNPEIARKVIKNYPDKKAMAHFIFDDRIDIRFDAYRNKIGELLSVKLNGMGENIVITDIKASPGVGEFLAASINNLFRRDDEGNSYEMNMYTREGSLKHDCFS